MLTERQRTERHYYDDFYARLDESMPVEQLLVDPHRPPLYFAGMERIVERAIGSLGPLGGKKVLAVGCGHGAGAAWLALHGAEVTAIDVSEAAVRMTARVARLNGVEERVHTLCVPAETIDGRFAPGAFDLAYGTEVLHHLDLESFAPALSRVMAPGGRAAFIEPAALHPLLHRVRETRLVKRILPVYRHTPTEEILTRGSLEVLGRAFRTEHDDFGAVIFLLGLAWRYRPLGRLMYRLAGVGNRPAPAAFEALAGRIFALDARLVARVPGMRALCRKTVVLLEKTAD